jgi:hypothetical protein
MKPAVLESIKGRGYAQSYWIRESFDTGLCPFIEEIDNTIILKLTVSTELREEVEKIHEHTETD